MAGDAGAALAATPALITVGAAAGGRLGLIGVLVPMPLPPLGSRSRVLAGVWFECCQSLVHEAAAAEVQEQCQACRGRVGDPALPVMIPANHRALAALDQRRSCLSFGGCSQAAPESPAPAPPLVAMARCCPSSLHSRAGSMRGGCPVGGIAPQRRTLLDRHAYASRTQPGGPAGVCTRQRRAPAGTPLDSKMTAATAALLTPGCRDAGRDRGLQWRLLHLRSR